MASSSKPTGVHYAFVFSVLLNIVCGVFLLLDHKGAGSIGELKAENAKLTKKSNDSDTVAKTALDEIDRIKKKLGSGFGDVGADDSNPNTVIGDMHKHIQDFSNGSPQPTYNATLVKQAEALRDLTMQRDKLKEDLLTEQATYQRQKDELNAQLAAEKAAREAADTGKLTADNTHSEELKKKEQDLAELRNQVFRTQQEYDEYKASTDAKVKQLDTRIQNLLALNRKIGDELEQKTRVSFEIPDGNIDWVDAVTRRVFVNLGEVDGMRPRTTFSVYRKKNSGVGRGARPGQTGPEDIKGAIEITRVTGPHQSEAKILDEDLYSPIGKGDPIYSPLWTSGRGESIAIIGVMDLDGDGKSDRDLFRELIATAGATIDNEVDDSGNLFVNGKPSDEKPKLTEKTKFLIKGKLPDPVAGKTDSAENLAANNIQKHYKEMDEQARERGIRVISLNDFLSFIGYKSQRRLYVPGGDTPFTLKNAGRGASAEQPRPGTVSTGNVSGLYSRDKKPSTNSSGQPVKGLFRSGSDGSSGK